MQLNSDDFERLEAMDYENNARLRESDFVRRLLPHLIPSEDGRKRDVSIYVAAAGHPNRMIDVVADSDPSKLLFTVPPLISQTPMVIRSLDAQPCTDIGEITAQFEAQITTEHPGSVINGFVQRLMAINFTPAEAIEVAYGRMWLQIYRRYNIPLERLFGDQAKAIEAALGPVKEEQPASSTRNTMDEIDEDDLAPI